MALGHKKMDNFRIYFCPEFAKKVRLDVNLLKINQKVKHTALSVNTIKEIKILLKEFKNEMHLLSNTDE